MKIPRKKMMMVSIFNIVWQKIDSKLCLFTNSNLPFVSKSMRTHPLAKIDDGYTDIILGGSHSNTGMCKMINYMVFNHDDGKIFDGEEKQENIKKDSGIEYIKTKAYRLIPKKSIKDSDLKALDYSINGDKNNNIKENDYEFKNSFSIDGEKYPVQPCQVVLKNKALRVFGYNS